MTLRALVTRWVFPVVVTAALVAWVARSVDLKQLTSALRAADWRWVLLSALLAGTLCMLFGALRLHGVLRRLGHDRPVGFWALASIQFAASAVHNVLPSPAGDVVRTVQLRQRFGYAVGALVTAQLVDKLVEALGLGLGTALFASLGQLPRAVALPMRVVAALGVAGTATVLVIGWRWTSTTHATAATATAGDTASRPSLRARIAGFVRRIGDAMHQLRAPSVWLRALVWSILGDLANAATVGLCLRAVGVSTPPVAWYVVMLGARVVGVLPSTPGQFGVQEAGVVVALGLFGVDRSRALAVALLHHAAHFAPVTLVGFVEVYRHHMKRS